MNDTEIKFVDTNPDALMQSMIVKYEALAGKTLHPGSPERLLILWAANIIVQERVNLNWAARQNIPRFAEGSNLDALSDIFHDVSRLPPMAATTTMRFYLSEKLGSAQLVPKGTRATADGNVFFETVEDVYIPIGSLYGDVAAKCQKAGELGNGLMPGQIHQLVDIFPFYGRCENITTSEGGAEEESDVNLYSRMRASEDTYSTAGSIGAYEYYAKTASTAIADVRANSPQPGYVNIYVLISGGKLPDDEIIAAVMAAATDQKVRPLTDYVSVLAPETVQYQIDLTYYIPTNSSASAKIIEEAVATAVETYKTWHCARMGRDVNPSHFAALLMQAGVKRIVLRSPTFVPVGDGKDAKAAQVAAVGSVTVVNGGFEDE